MTATLIGYARRSTDKQDLAAQRQILLDLAVPAERIYLNRVLAGTNRRRPGLDRALAAARSGDTLWCRSWTGWPGPCPTPAISATLVARGCGCSSVA